jgi:LDH2 family malate/lactate/ureidoglycolate dehydrogenase
LTELSIEALRSFGRRAYEQAGMPPDDARVVVDVQLEADLRGVDTHGLQRLPWYVDRLLAGENNPRARVRVVRESPVSVLVDGDNGLGQLVCTRLMEKMVAKGAAAGLAVGASRGSNDWGCGASYPLLAARAGLVGFGTTTSVPTLAPFGSATRMTGNNPIVYAVPRRDGPPIVLDMALTPVALGKVLRAAADGQPIPAAWGFLDRDGRPTTDPEAALSGVIPAIGGYKGTGLSLVMNVLAGILPGGVHSGAVANAGGRRGQLFWVADPDLLGDRARFLDDVEAMVAQVRRAEPLPGSDGVFLPGELEARRAERALARGTISYPRSVVGAITELAGQLGIALDIGDRGRTGEGDTKGAS